MEIVGLGTQIVECTRVAKLIDRHGETFLAQVYTDGEIQFCNGRTHVNEHYTAIWAAKEAVLRSLGAKWHRGLNWTEIEIACEKGQAPVVGVAGATDELMVERGAGRFLLSMAHCRAFATATCLALR
ncbi:MAG TPA: holo-ACP synthase [Urbifossiella sp.]|jgi:holo-[acyl-carrier protein] synthase|nr:holo-ACP synthase [Urbifossiella sp.]